VRNAFEKVSAVVATPTGLCARPPYHTAARRTGKRRLAKSKPKGNSASNGITTTSSVGYGSPFFNNSGCNTEAVPTANNAPAAGGTCNGDIRNIQEGTLGFWHRFYKGPKGTVQWGIQYSYLVKNTWSGNNNTPANVGVQPKAIENMVLTSFRYYLP